MIGFNMRLNLTPCKCDETCMRTQVMRFHYNHMSRYRDIHIYKQIGKQVVIPVKFHVVNLCMW